MIYNPDTGRPAFLHPLHEDLPDDACEFEHVELPSQEED